MGTGFIQAQKTDVVIMKNGDKITGEIKKMDRGLLRYSTDDMGTIFIEWPKVSNIFSKDIFEVENEIGQKFFGHLQNTSEKGKIMVVSKNSQDSLPIGSIIRIIPLEKKFLQRLKIILSVGFSYNKASQDTQWNFAGSISSRGKKQEFKAEADSFLSDRERIDSTTRNSLQLMLRRFLKNRRSLILLASARQNDELGLDYRFLAGGAYGYTVIQTNKTNLAFFAGLVGTNEQFSGFETSQWNAEILLGVTYDTFKYEGNTVDITTSLAVYPGITTWGRYRAELRSSLRIEIFKDFFWGLTFFDDFDSDPPVTGDYEKNDFGISVSVGWAYNK
jgi:hypothetical protein